MLIGDIPEGDEIEAGYFGTGATGRLIDAMMRAIGFDRASIYQTALAHSQPATGAIPPGDLANLRTIRAASRRVGGPDADIAAWQRCMRSLFGAEFDGCARTFTRF